MAAVASVGAMITQQSWASDHVDAPSLVTDPGVDIGDVYAFMDPASTSRMVLAMTVHPGAAAADTFDTKVEYAFHLRAYDAATGALDPSVDEQIACRFQAPDNGTQRVVCSANGFSAIGTLNEADAGSPSDSLRIFAGLRADPAFGDVAALSSTIAAGQLKLTDAGTNAFAGKNVLALVVSVDLDQVILANYDAGGGPRPLLAVSATTERLP